MSLKSKCETSVLLPKANFDSYVVLAMAVLKERTIQVLEYDENVMHEVLAHYNKIPDEPSIVDNESAICGGIPAIQLYLDKRYPVPALLPGDYKSIGRRFSLCQILLRSYSKVFQSYFVTGDKKRLLKENLKLAKNLNEVCSIESMQFKDESPTIIEAVFMSVFIHLEESGINLSKFKAYSGFSLYMNKVMKSQYYDKCKIQLDRYREEPPFYKKEGFCLNDFLDAA